MVNYLTVQLSSALQLPTEQELYIYIIGGVPDGTSQNYYSYKLSADGNFVATQGSKNVVHAIPLSSLGTLAGSSLLYFNFDQSENFSGRIWFSNSDSLLTISNLQVVQPEPSSGLLFDFAELTLNAGLNVNIDTTQVVGLCIPITVVDPAVVNFPLAAPYTDCVYPNAIGIVPGNTLQDLQTNFSTYLNTVGLNDFAVCSQSYTTGTNPAVNWLINPGYQVPAYVSGTTPSGLSVSFDDMLFDFFNYFFPVTSGGKGGSLIIQFNNLTYTGITVQQCLDAANPTQLYCALVFTDTNNNQYPIFYPYFSSNSAATQGGALNPGGQLPPAPSWWATNGLADTIPASGQVLQNEGVFKDGNTNVTDQTVLAALQNIVVTMINRGLIPGDTMNNLFVCNGQLSLDVIPVTFNDKAPKGTVNGASLIYSPSQIPAENITNATVSVSVVLNYDKKDPTQAITQVVTDNIVAIPSTLPDNYCTSPVTVQLGSGQQTEFVFSYDSAVWTVAPELSGSASITYYPTVANAPTATFTAAEGKSFPGGIAIGMNVLDANVQNPSTVSAIGTNSIKIASSINGLLPSPSPDTLLIGNFYPVDSAGVAKGCWNAFAGFLHYGCANVTAPYISNQGYAFAYDDDGGYSSDITVTFPENGDCAIGIYLGPLS